MSDTVKTLDAGAKTLMALAELGLETAKKLGADGAKISVSSSLQRRLVVEAKEFSLANSLESRSIGIVVHKDQKKGSASINTVTEEGIKHAVESALALAKYSVADPALTFASRVEAPPAKALPFLFEAALADVELPEIQETMQVVLERLVKDPRVALDRYEMAVDVAWHGLVNSLGMRQQERQALASWSFFGMARDGDEVTGFDYDGSFSYRRDHLLPTSLAEAGKFVDKVVGMLKPRQCPSYRGPVLLTPRAVQELIIGMITYHAGGRQVMDGKSRWEKSVGQEVVSQLLCLRDMPHDSRFSGATAFDGDGVPTRAQEIINDGRLVRHMHDAYSAKRCGATTTATSGGPFALALKNGTTALSDILSGNPQLLVVDRFSGNSDPIKGDFSGVAKGSRLYQNGVDVGAITETMIAGNFFEVMRQVLATTREEELVSGGFLSPYVLVDGISVTGS